MAGIVLVQKFIQPGGAAYKGYVDYMDRPEAIGIDPDLKKYDIFGTYQEYMGNPEKSTGLFNEQDHIDPEEKDTIKEIFNQSGRKGGLLYQTVLSFEPEWLKENGIMNDDGYIHEDLLREYTRTAVNTIQEKEDMKSFVWTAAVHYNTAHPHVHIAMVDPEPSWTPGRGRCRVNNQGELYQRGKWKGSTMDAAKSRIVNKVLDVSSANKTINEIMRERIILQSKNESFHKEYDQEIAAAFSDLMDTLPDDMRLWKYGNNAMKSFHERIDHISELIMKKYFSKDLNELDDILDSLSKKYESAYGDRKKGNDFKENKKADLRYRMGNAVLEECRKIQTSRQKLQQKSNGETVSPLKQKKVQTRFRMNQNRYAVAKALNALRSLAYKNIQNMKNQAAYERSFMEDLGRDF